ncbi:MAG: SCP2 sterol-binding domain-containing protein [Gammaproteobacteria bacterium]|nr:SCP2 sterol-binding domain-containing protein [Gammaproteobacteria bacterium]
MALPQLFITSLETALNSYLALDVNTVLRLAEMEGQVIRLEILGLNENLYLFPASDGIMLLSDFDAEADTTLSGTPAAFARLGLLDDAAPVLFSGEIKIAGNTRLGHQFKKILSAIDIDWEEELAKVVGDLVAHQAGNVFRGFQGWFERSSAACAMDAGEYLQEESRLLPSNAEVARFVGEVDELREACDRLGARLKRLKDKTSNSKQH